MFQYYSLFNPERILEKKGVPSNSEYAVVLWFVINFSCIYRLIIAGVAVDSRTTVNNSTYVIAESAF